RAAGRSHARSRWTHPPPAPAGPPVSRHSRLLLSPTTPVPDRMVRGGHRRPLGPAPVRRLGAGRGRGDEFRAFPPSDHTSAFPAGRPQERPMDLTFPGESAEYRRARDQLLDDEIELRRAMERVAVARRALPLGGAAPEDYEFVGAEGRVRLSDLFGGHASLTIYHWMFPRHAGDDRPAPSSGPLS